MASDVMGSPFDYPLSSRLDENDAILVLDKAFVPWENVFIYENVAKSNTAFPLSGVFPRFLLHGCTRLAVKLDFIAGLVLKAIAMVGSSDSRSVQPTVGEILAWRNTMWALSDAMVHGCVPWGGGTVLPNPEYAQSYRVLSTIAYPRIQELIKSTLGTGLIYINSHAVDFASPELRPYLDKYMRGSDGSSAKDRTKLMKLLWDAVGSEFAGRNTLYELNFSGSPETARVLTYQMMQSIGKSKELTGMVDRCMAEYDLQGWTAPDLVPPGELTVHGDKGSREPH
jgi:4-hydroxyphenylacetate 3-monooxygenase